MLVYIMIDDKSIVEKFACSSDFSFGRECKDGFPCVMFLMLFFLEMDVMQHQNEYMNGCQRI